MKIILLLAALGLGSIPQVLVAQTADESIDVAIARAQSAGVSVNLLRTKVDEGFAKGVPIDRIVAAVENRAALLICATRTFASTGIQASEADLAASADALGVGVSDAVLLRVGQDVTPERRAVAITTLTDLISRSVPVDQAIDRVMDGLSRGPSGDIGSRGDQGGRGGRPVPAASGVTSSTGGPVQLPPAVGRGGEVPGPGGPPDLPPGEGPRNGV